jgi:hypothetical protein
MMPGVTDGFPQAFACLGPDQAAGAWRSPSSPAWTTARSPARPVDGSAQADA